MNDDATIVSSENQCTQGEKGKFQNGAKRVLPLGVRFTNKSYKNVDDEFAENEKLFLLLSQKRFIISTEVQ